MYEEERLIKIAEYVKNRARASVQELCELFGVSESTMRRDLSELESRALLKRTHGGAVFLESVSFEPTFSEKEDKYREEKEGIAKAAAKLIEEGDSLIIDSGTTTHYLAQELTGFKELTVVTNSIGLIQQLSSMANINVVSTGGMLRKNTMALVGPVAEASLDQVRVDKAFMATNGLDVKAGLTTPNLLEAAIKQKMISVAEKVIVLADHSKIGHVSFAKFGSAADIDVCITGGIKEEQRVEFERKNIKMYVTGCKS